MDKAKKKHPICNHCGGALTMDGDMLKCLMCGREAGHHCELCMIHPEEKDNKRKRKSAARR